MLARNSFVMISSESAASSAAKASSREEVRAREIRSSAKRGAGMSAPVYFLAEMALPVRTARSQVFSSIVKSVRDIFNSPLMTLAANCTECSRKSGAAKHASEMPSPKASVPESILLLFKAFPIMTLTAFSGPISLGSR